MMDEKFPPALKQKIEDGIERGLADIEAGRYFEMTPENSQKMLERFKQDLKKNK